MCNILIDMKHKALINAKTGFTVYPSCFDDLVQYHGYLLGSKHPKEAKRLLKEVMRTYNRGERIISDLIKNARGGKIFSS